VNIDFPNFSIKLTNIPLSFNIVSIRQTSQFHINISKRFRALFFSIETSHCTLAI